MLDFLSFLSKAFNNVGAILVNCIQSENGAIFLVFLQPHYVR